MTRKPRKSQIDDILEKDDARRKNNEKIIDKLGKGKGNQPKSERGGVISEAEYKRRAAKPWWLDEKGELRKPTKHHRKDKKR